MGEVVIESGWSPEVRSAAAALRRTLRASRRNLELRLRGDTDRERALLLASAEEALAVTRLMIRLDQGGRRAPTPRRDAVQLELRVHEEEGDASTSFFRALEAVREGTPLETALARGERLSSTGPSRELREERIQVLRDVMATLRERERGDDIPLPWDRRDSDQAPEGGTTRLRGGSKLESLQAQLERLIKDDGRA